MKKLLISTFLSLAFLISDAQIKVVTGGEVKIGDTGTEPLSEMHLTGNFTIEPTSGVLGVISGGNSATQRFTMFNGGGSNLNSASYFSMNGSTSNANFVFNGKFISFLVDKNPGDFGSEKMRLTSGGSLGIGEVNPVWTLHVNGTAGKTGGGEFSTVSDKRLKSDVNDYRKGLKELLKIRPVTFKYNGKGGLKKSNKQHVGVIAQEFQKIDPDNVVKIELVDSQQVIDYDEGGQAYPNHKTLSKQEYLSVDASSIKYMLVNAVKEQQAMIQAQNDKIAKLEALVKGLTNNIDNSLPNTNIILSAGKIAELAQNVPNPFNENTKISYIIPDNAQTAEMLIFNLNGKLMKRVDIDHIGQGMINISTLDLPTGSYSYSLKVDSQLVSTKKMVLTK